MAWFRRKTDGSEGKPSRVHIAEGLWIKCDSCKEIVYRAEVERAGRVCPKCLYPFRVSARERIALLADPGTFEERDTNLESTDPLGFRDTKKYRDRIRAAVEKTKADEAVLSGVARIGGLPSVLCVFEFGFLGGSMGSVVGEKLTRAIELAETIRQPLPEGFQRSEFLLEHGQIDFIVDRRELKETLRRILAFFAGEPPRSG